VPIDTPVTTPELLTVATPVLALLHAPVPEDIARAVVFPGQTVAVPEMVPTAGAGFTVAATVARSDPQPFVTEYDMVALPSATPVTTPELFTVAMLVLELLHAPPAPVVLSADVADWQTEASPVIEPALGVVFTVTSFVTINTPQAFVTA
jgi:hypothetical protein